MSRSANHNGHGSARLSWTTSCPGHDGFFFYKDIPSDSGDLVLVDDGVCYAPGVALAVPLSAMYGWWAGPLVPPSAGVVSVMSAPSTEFAVSAFAFVH